MQTGPGDRPRPAKIVGETAAPWMRAMPPINVSRTPAPPGNGLSMPIRIGSDVIPSTSKGSGFTSSALSMIASTNPWIPSRGR